MSIMLSLEGKQLGNYDVIKRIRVGGMGAVYEGRQRTAFDRRVAIKVILGDYAADPEMRRRFAREARTVARLQHPHILPLIEFGDEAGILYLVMPFIDGGTLTSYLRRSLPELGEVSVMYQQLLDAVEYAHDSGLIHRDIKSSNVLLEQRRNGSPHVYLADFGLVRTRRQTEQERAGQPIPLDQVPGTPHYMAPEQTRGIITPLTDIYALGVLLYQMLTGELPYNDEDDIRVIQMHLHAPIPSPCDADASIPRELGEVVRTAMAKRPEARYKNVAELRRAFVAALKGPVSLAAEDVQELDEYKPPVAKQRASMPLLPADPDGSQGLDVPAVMPRRQRNASPLPIVVHERPRITDNVKQRATERHKQRITEEPGKPDKAGKVQPIHLAHTRVQAKPRRGSSSRLWYVTMLVPLILLILVLMPRVLNFSFFPSGFPIFGTPPVALVYITAQSKDFQNTYVLTASPKVQQPDLATHTIPDRQLQASMSDTRVVPTTGTKTLPGTQARGTILFTNTTNQPVPLSAQLIVTTPQGVQLQLTQGVIVPPHNDGQDGAATAAAVAVVAGAAGNIPELALDGPCCTAGIVARNLAPFTGGADGQTVHVVAQADLDGAKAAALLTLQPQVAQQLARQLHSNEAVADQPASAVTVSSNPSVGTQADQVQVVTRLLESEIVYNSSIASHTALQLLIESATQTLGSSYTLQGAPAETSMRIVNQEKDGRVFLDVAVHGTWVYTFTLQQLEQWRQTIKGATTAAALAYLNEQAGVGGVQIRLPFGADHFPTNIDEIKIIPIVGS
jgi:serine/threonine protein kinase